MNDLENKMSEENPKKLSWWQVLLLILTALLIVGLILVNFLCSENRFVITGSIVTLICLLIVIVLSNSFDSFSIVGIFNLRREVKENREKIDKLENLMFQSVNNNLQAQHASNSTNISINTLGVQDQTSDDKARIKEDERQQEEEEDKVEATRMPRPRLDREKFAELLLQKYLKQNNLLDKIIKKDVKIADEIQNSDSISNRPITFRAYIKDDDKELFVDTFSSVLSSFMFSDRLYVKVSKVLNYREIKNANAKTVCLIGKPDSERERFNVSKLQSDFLPAITNNLLDIVTISYSEEDYNSCLKQS